MKGIEIPLLIRQTLTLAVCLLRVLCLSAQPLVYTHMDAFDGLSSNQIHSILQLPDGRMAFITPNAVNLYDGSRFRYWPIEPADTCVLADYYGACHAYAEGDSLLWVKHKHRLCCLDLKRGKYRPQPELLFLQDGMKENVTDFFLDSNGNRWLVTRKGVWDVKGKRLFALSQKANLQDIMVDEAHAYFFFGNGTVTCYHRRNAQRLYTQAAYPEAESLIYARTSLVVKGTDGNFYQLRCGRESVCLSFNPHTRQWKRLLHSRETLHTLVTPNDSTAYISCGKGLWKIHLKQDSAEYCPSVEISEGGSVVADHLYVERCQPSAHHLPPQGCVQGDAEKPQVPFHCGGREK